MNKRSMAALLPLVMASMPGPMNYSRKGAHIQPKMSTVKRKAQKKRKAARKARRNNR